MKIAYLVLGIFLVNFTDFGRVYSKTRSSVLPGVYEEVTKDAPEGCGQFIKVVEYPEGHPSQGIWIFSSDDPKNFPSHGTHYQREPFKLRLTHDISFLHREGTRINHRRVYDYERGLLAPALFLPVREKTVLKVSRFNKNRLIYKGRSKILWLIPFPGEDNWTSKYIRLDPSDPRLAPTGP